VPRVAAILVIVAIGIGVLTIVINGQPGWRLGGSLLASVTFAGMAMAADLLAITLPTAAASLWHARRPGMAVLAWLTWTLAAGKGFTYESKGCPINSSRDVSGVDNSLSSCTKYTNDGPLKLLS
jgi:hypothetical protein